MISSVKVTNYLNESILLELSSPEKSGLIVRSIDGLGSANANINMTTLATVDGDRYNSARANSRNIIFNLQFIGTPTIEDTRHLTYKYFPLKKPVTLIFTTDNRELKITGYVESNDPNIFSETQTTQISILCPYPYFISTTSDETVFYGLDPVFEFPFSNESLTDRLIEFAHIRLQTYGVIYYTGDIEVGLDLFITSSGDASNISIYNLETREGMFIDTSRIEGGIRRGDRININTRVGEKSITLLRDGQTYNIRNALARDTQWFLLSKGDNVFAYTAEFGLENLKFEATSNTIYGGI